MTPLEIIDAIEEQRAAMIEVSTGGYARIDELEPGYKERRAQIRRELLKLGLEDHNIYVSLRRWYDRWSAGDLPTYKSRRKFVNDIYDPLVERLREVVMIGSGLFKEVTGWERVDRVIDRIRRGLEGASPKKISKQSVCSFGKQLSRSRRLFMTQGDIHSWTGRTSAQPTLNECWKRFSIPNCLEVPTTKSGGTQRLHSTSRTPSNTVAQLNFAMQHFVRKPPCQS